MPPHLFSLALVSLALVVALTTMTLPDRSSRVYRTMRHSGALLRAVVIVALVSIQGALSSALGSTPINVAQNFEFACPNQKTCKLILR